MATNRWLCACAVAALALQAHDASAQDNVNCLAEIGDVVVRGDLQVVGKCTLAGTDVRGNVTLFAGGSLTARAARIRGNLEARADSRADFVDIDGSRVDGNVRSRSSSAT